MIKALLFGLALVIIYAALTAFLKLFKSKKSQHLKDTTVSKQKMAKYGFASQRQKPTSIQLEKPNIHLTDETKKVLDLLENTSRNIFVTGKAGTGKSTLLRYFRATTKKRVAVIAPTGVAALNVQGQTIHKFFKFRQDITLEKVQKQSGRQAEVYSNIDTLIIDEVSMVRSDWLDCVEKALRIHSKNRYDLFGGVQIVLIGDPYQLPPVRKEGEDEIFTDYYPSELFFHSKSFRQGEFATIELTHVYRQADPEFVQILNSIRVGNVGHRELEIINTRVGIAPHDAAGGVQITLVPTRKLAEEINIQHLQSLPKKERIYRGARENDFDDSELPTPTELVLREGAQVMMLNNDPKGRWVNGDLAIVAGFGEKGVRVLFKDGTYADVDPHTWEATRFTYNKAADKIESTVVGRFTQVPLKLAWAITIHKSQGQTYTSVRVDFGQRVYHPGQAYVALSRARSLTGLTLGRPLRKSDITVDPRVQEFIKHSLR